MPEETELEFIYTGASDSGLTSVWFVNSKRSTVYLGKISWYANWRRYTFRPGVETVFDSKCLKEIKEFIDIAMEQRKSNG